MTETQVDVTCKTNIDEICSILYSMLNVESVWFFEKLIVVYHTTRCHMAEV